MANDNAPSRRTSLALCSSTALIIAVVVSKGYLMYVIGFMPHSDVLKWAAVFVVNPDMIFGEIIRDRLHVQLTHGDTDTRVTRFQFDYKQWRFSGSDPAAEAEIKRAVELIRVTDRSKQAVLKKRLRAEFAHDYLQGYIETMVWPDNRTFVIDYNHLLPTHI